MDFYGPVIMKHGASELHQLHKTEHKLNAPNIMAVRGSKEQTTLSIRYCNSRYDLEKNGNLLRS